MNDKTLTAGKPPRRGRARNLRVTAAHAQTFAAARSSGLAQLRVRRRGERGARADAGAAAVRGRGPRFAPGAAAKLFARGDRGSAALPSRDDVTAAIRQTLAAVGHRTAPLALGVPQS